MQPEVRKLLLDVRRAGEAVLQHAADLTPRQYEQDVLIRSLVERQFEIIGEALRRLERLDPGTASRIDHLRRIIDFRNVIAHGYDQIDPVVVSQVVRRFLPDLLAQVVRLLSQPGAETG